RQPAPAAERWLPQGSAVAHQAHRSEAATPQRRKPNRAGGSAEWTLSGFLGQRIPAFGQSIHQMFHVRLVMRRTAGDPQSRAACRYRRRTDGTDQNAALAQRRRELQSTLTAANDDRLNRGRAIHQAQADLCGTLAETRDQLAQMLTPPVLAAQQLQAFQGGAGDGRRLAGCIYVGPGKLDQRL